MKVINAKVEDLKELTKIVESMQPGYVTDLAEGLHVSEPDVIVRATQTCCCHQLAPERDVLPRAG
jgi:hypothetical protein